jgi:DNA polymerase-1
MMPPDEQRRVSKMVNYALLYGKTAFTLAKDLDVPRKQAEEFIAAYFARYSDVRRFIDETIEKARETGTVRTLLGRLRRLPDLRSPNFPIRAEAERQAMNTPVQGSAADLVKKARGGGGEGARARGHGGRSPAGRAARGGGAPRRHLGGRPLALAAPLTPANSGP